MEKEIGFRNDPRVKQLREISNKPSGPYKAPDAARCTKLLKWHPSNIKGKSNKPYKRATRDSILQIPIKTFPCPPEGSEEDDGLCIGDCALGFAWVVHVTVVHWRLCDVPIVTCRKVSRFGVLRLLESWPGSVYLDSGSHLAALRGKPEKKAEKIWTRSQLSKLHIMTFLQLLKKFRKNCCFLFPI